MGLERIRVHWRAPSLQRELIIDRTKDSRLLTAGAAILATSAGLVLLFPLLQFLLVYSRNALLAGDGGDDWLYLFYIETGLAKILGSDPRPFFDAGYFFPTHASSLLYTEHHLGVTAVLALLKPWFSDTLDLMSAGTILAIIGGLAGTFAWARYLGATRLAAIVATLAFTGSGGFLALMPRPFFWAIGLVPVVAILAHRVRRNPTLLRGVAFGLALGFLGWCSSHLVVMGSLFTVLGLLVPLRSSEPMPPDSPFKALRSLLFGLVVAVLVVAPFAIPQARTLLTNGFERSLADQARDVPSLTGLIGTPWMASRQWLQSTCSLSAPTGEVFSGISPWVVLTLIIAAVVGLARVPGRTASRPFGAAIFVGALSAGIAWILPSEMAGITVDRPCTSAVYGFLGFVLVLLGRRLRSTLATPLGATTFTTLVLACMTLGPMLRTENGGIPTPAILLCRLPGLSAIRLSARWGIVMNLAASGAFAAALSALSSRRLQVAIGLALAFVLIRDVAQPNHFALADALPQRAPFAERPVDRILRELPASGAVMELPWLDGPKEVPRMMSIRAHGRPLVNGYAGMVPSFFAYHAAQAAPALIQGRVPNDYEMRSFRAFGARYWVIHLDRMPSTARAAWSNPALPLRLVAECDEGRTLVIEDTAPSSQSVSDLPSTR